MIEFNAFECSTLSECGIGALGLAVLVTFGAARSAGAVSCGTRVVDKDAGRRIKILQINLLCNIFTVLGFG